MTASTPGTHTNTWTQMLVQPKITERTAFSVYSIYIGNKQKVAIGHDAHDTVVLLHERRHPTA
jgi:hypothetical protein